MREIGFAAIVTPMSDEMAISHVPVVVKNDGHRFCTIETHVARANPHWNGIAGAESTAIFQGPFAYISPSWYPSKAEHGKVVPTWNYVAIHASGRFEAIEDAAGSAIISTGSPSSMSSRVTNRGPSRTRPIRSSTALHERSSACA